MLDAIRSAMARGHVYADPTGPVSAAAIDEILCEPIACSALIDVAPSGAGWVALPVE